jgi:hypothetical protein
MLQQISFGGVPAISYCLRCKKPLSNPVSIDAGMGPICRGHGGREMDTCQKDKFADEDIDENIPLSNALVLQRDGDDDHAIIRTNVPHLVVHHSPSGFEFGYGGSGPADLALNVCQFYLNSIGYRGEKTECFDGTCWSLAWVLHQDFKWAFIANAPRKGIVIDWVVIKQWFTEHITSDLIKTYGGQIFDEPDDDNLDISTEDIESGEEYSRRNHAR